MTSNSPTRRGRQGPGPTPCRRCVRAFTLVELLVAIGIIALLISILLPALGRARRAASAIACAANIRTILQGMQMYVSENRGYFPGGANTTGARLMLPGYNNNNCPGVTQIFDWQAPIANQLNNVAFTEGETLPERQARFRALMENGTFRCPENETLAVPFGGGGWPTVTMNSYVTSMIFHMKHNPANNAGDGRQIARNNWNPPPGYVPLITKIGNGSRKIFIADGARYSTTTVRPDYDPAYNGTFGGAYSDQGAFTRFSRAWDRGMAPGNGGKGTDARIYGFRHGVTGQKGGTNAYRLNVGFFDGHVEMMGDLQVAEPSLWVPEGTAVEYSSAQMYPDVLARYGPAGVRPAE